MKNYFNHFSEETEWIPVRNLQEPGDFVVYDRSSGEIICSFKDETEKNLANAQIICIKHTLLKACLNIITKFELAEKSNFTIPQQAALKLMKEIIKEVFKKINN